MAKKFEDRKFNLSEEEMQELVVASQDGDTSAQLRLLEVFSNFLAKYNSLLFTGKYSFEDYDIRRFIGLYVKDSRLRFPLMRNKLNMVQIKKVHEVMRGILYMINRYADPEDVEQTVAAAFLHCVFVYKKKGSIPFSGYIYGYYFYVLKKMVDEFLIDQTGRKTFPLVDNDDLLEGDSEGEPIQGFAAPPEPGVEELLGPEVIDEYWVVGDTVTPPFDVLTIQERQLLKWRFVDGERSSTIAERITEHPNTVRDHFNHIREKIAKQVSEDLS